MSYSKSTVSIDITQSFRDAAASLEIGQLIKEDHFTLFDAVQGLEIGHPTMDAGLLDEGETLDDDYDVSQNLLPEEIIWIMDQLLAYQIAWHQGFSLVQNVFSSVHIDNLLSMEREEGQPPKYVNLSNGASPNELVQTVLRAFCISVIKSCDIVIDVIRGQEYYEEEDVNTQTCDRSMLNDFTDKDYIYMLHEAYVWVQQKRRRGGLSDELADAFLARLAFNPRLLEPFIPIAEDVQTLSSRQLSVEATLKVIKNTHHIGIEVPDVFTTKLQRKLASTTPPRKLNTISFEDAMIIAEKIFRDLGEACSCDVLGSSPDLQRIEAFLWSFSARNPLPFPRAAMQTMLLMFVEPVSEGFEPIESVLWHELQGLLPSQNFLSPKILELEAPNDEGFKACQAVRHWFAECGHVALTYLKSLCQNRCRIRRRLAHVLRDVDNVHMATVQVFGDTAPQSARSLSRFAQSRILLVTAFLELRIMTGIIELGFELDLHSQQELARLSTYQTSLYSLMSSMRTRVVKEDRNHSWVQLARQTAARCPSLDPGRDHLLARTLRGTYLDAVHKSVQAMATLHTVLHQSGAYSTAPSSGQDHLRQIRERLRTFHSLDMGRRAEVMYDVYLRPETTSVDVTDPSPTHDILNSMGETPQEVKQLLTNFGIPKVQAKAFRSTWADADLGATADSDEYWRLELRDMYKAAIFMGLEMAKVRDLMKKKGGDLGSIKTNVGLEKMQYFGRHLMIPQLLIAER